MKSRQTYSARVARREQGVAIILVFVLLLMMSVLLVANSVCLRSTKEDLNRIERNQLRYWSDRAPGK